ncbi:MAG: G8 domain-containing protein [Anaerolineae bacterium]|nr:G8 domain-containing protein [Anaerolineae bacterium]
MLRKRFFHLVIGSMAALFLAAASGAHPAAAEPQATCTSNGNGNWTAISWTGCAGVPQNGDDVIIAAANTVTVNANTNTLASLTVNGTLNVGNNNTARTITVNGPVSINTGGTFQVPVTSNTTHSLIVRGNFINDGTFNARTDGNSLMTTTFGGTASQTVSGTGATTNFNLITVNNTGGAGNNIVEIASTNFAPANGFLTLTNGILKLAGSYTLSNNIFTAAAYTIPASGGLWLDNPNVTVNGQNGTATLNGRLQITQGTYNVGSGDNNNHLEYGNNAELVMDGGSLNVHCYFRNSNFAGTNIINFQMFGGTMTVMNRPSNCTTGGGRGSFDISSTDSSFHMDGGTIVIGRENTNSTDLLDYRNIADTVTITGGTVQFGNNSSPTGGTYNVGATAGTNLNVLPNVVLNQTNPPSATLRRTTFIYGSLTISTGATLNANGQAVNISGDWTNNGTFTSGTQTTTFNGTAPQTISGSTTTAFSTLVVNSGATVIIPDAPTIPTAAVAVTNNGTMQQTRPVNNANVDFLHITDGTALVRYRGVTIDTTPTGGTNLGSTTVTVRHLNTGEYCTEHGATSPTYAGRCYQITPTTDGAARVRLWALTGSELNGIAEANLSVYRNQPDGGPTWVELTTNRATGNADAGVYSYAEGDAPGFSHFLLGQAGFAPTAVTLTTFTTATAMPFTAVVVIFLVLFSLLAMGAWQLAVIRNR